jgi:hypothetical protein
MKLAAFLLDRILEAEAVAREATPGPWRSIQWRSDAPDEPTLYGVDAGLRDGLVPVVPRSPERMAGRDADHIALLDPVRVLAECAALRRVVEIHQQAARAAGEGLAFPTRAVLHALALPYADHPDYDPSWLPQ